MLLEYFTCNRDWHLAKYLSGTQNESFAAVTFTKRNGISACKIKAEKLLKC